MIWNMSFFPKVGKRSRAVGAGLLALALVIAGRGWSGERGPANGSEKKEKSLREWKSDFQNWWPQQKAEFQERRSRLKVVRRPETVLHGYDPDPALWEAVTKFYDHLKSRELDVIYEQEGIPDFFPDRSTYYNFLDTMLPAMRDRRFERNRLLDYQVHAITQDPARPDEATVLLSITSDDLLPFGKLMVFRQAWLRQYRWYPGKVEADPATYWERIR